MGFVLLAVLYFFIGVRAMEMVADIKASRSPQLQPIQVDVIEPSTPTAEWDESFVDGLRQ